MSIIQNIPTADELKNLPPDGGDSFNRLVFEKSPYLLQHARNPVNWYPWGNDAFEIAKELDLPVFLSIGYSTCHWCHVMEKESFEDDLVVALLNDNFISIKVDREERPDIDQIYMAVCQAVTGQGGWPLTVILTPEKQPFFAGTYFPKESRFGRTGMTDLIPRIRELWFTKREELEDNAAQITNQIRLAGSKPGKLSQDITRLAFEQLSSRYDPLYGGFGSSPKFPSAHNLIFLLRYWHQTGDSKALEMVEKTLEQIRLGGIYDQVGFGFHRYSTDEAWLLPHFEKMLYDQALLVMAYIEAFQATGKVLYARIAREVLSYILRDMTAPGGGFFSAEDADSEGEEGLFYQWSISEFEDILGRDSSDLFVDVFNLKDEGNYYDESEKSKTGRNILYLKRQLGDLSGKFNLTEDQLRTLWENIRQTLFDVREKRVHPFKDDKILTDWNGLMIAALAKAAAALDEPGYLSAAKKAVDFIWDNLRDEHGRLLKRFRDGEAGQPSHLDDYAFMVWGLIEIYQADFDPEYLQKAVELNDLMINEFWDERSGGLFISGFEQTDLIVRSKEIYDGAIPSGNSVSVSNFLRLARLTQNHDLEHKAHLVGEVFAKQVNPVPQGFTHLLSGLIFSEGPSYEVVISGNTTDEDTRLMLGILHNGYHPNVVTLLRPSEDPDSLIFKLSPFLKDQPMITGKATAYVCQEFTCKSPITSIDELKKSLV